MKRALATILVFTLCMVLLAGCGGTQLPSPSAPTASPAMTQQPTATPQSEATQQPTSTTEPTNEPMEIDDGRVDACNISAVCPDGWESRPWEGDDASNNLKFFKDLEGDFMIGYVPQININYKTGGDLFDVKAFYDDAEDWGPETIGDRSWEGFTATWNDEKVAILESGDLTLNIWLEMANGKSISLDDKDLRDIIASIEY